MQPIKSLAELAERLAGEKHLVFHPSVSESSVIGQQLDQHASLWPGLTIETFMPGHLPAYVGNGHLSVTSVMPGPHLRAAANEGLIKPLRESLFQQARAYETGQRRADILVLQVSPPDGNGRVSLGPGVGIMPQVLAQDPFVIGVINRHVPVTNHTIPVGRLDAVLHHDSPLPIYQTAAADPIDEKIAQLAASQIKPGMTVEVGMGNTPDAVMMALAGIEDLHIHTGLINDAVRSVVEAGGLRRPVTTTMAVGSEGFYQWLNHNPQVEFQPISETHNVDRLAQLPRFHAINAALQVDLSGNVNAERLGSRLVSLPGGLPDFAAGARRSDGGCNIIVLRSSAGRQNKSTIVDRVDHITLAGSMVDMVITEFGIADLRNLSNADRRSALVAIAHPQHSFGHSG